MSPELSRLLAKKVQIAIYKGDIEMVNKIRAIKSDDEVTKDIIDYN